MPRKKHILCNTKGECFGEAIDVSKVWFVQEVMWSAVRHGFLVAFVLLPVGMSI